MYTFLKSFIKKIRTRQLKNNIQVTDLSRWKTVETETYKWDERNLLIASFIPAGSSVLDIGAGAQTLKNYLRECKYIPCDVIRRPDTLFCDLNNDIFPSTNEKFDYVVCSGVIEYLIRPQKTIKELSRYGEKIILSYALADKNNNRKKRLASGWKNHLSKKQIEGFFLDVQFTWIVLNYWQDQIIYLVNTK